MPDDWKPAGHGTLDDSQDSPEEESISVEHAPRPTSSVDFSLLEDWPTSDPIDLVTQDRPHTSATAEYWSLHAHFETVTGRRLGVFATFFRQAQPPDAPGQGAHAQSVVWALIDGERRLYRPVCAVDRFAPARALGNGSLGTNVHDDRVNRAMKEILERNRVPAPTRMFRHAPVIAADTLSLEYDANRLLRRPNGAYELHLLDPDAKTAVSLTLLPQKAPTRHGDGGLIRTAGDQVMFHYFIPRCSVTGAVALDGERIDLRDGSGWYDHEFGFVSEMAQGARGGRTSSWDSVWSWALLQLDDGRDVAVYSLADSTGSETLELWVVVSERDGTRRQYSRASFRPVETWRSTRTFVGYPVTWTLRVPGAGLSLRLEATFPEQEVVTVLSAPGFWRGEVRVAGMIDEQAVVGRGWVGRGGSRFQSVDDLLGAVADAVREQVGKHLPLKPTSEEAYQLALGPAGVGGGQGIDGGVIARTLFAPVREIVERSSKAWRSFAMLGSIDVVGGDSTPFRRWLAFPEIAHAAMLILEDVETQSYVRRAGPSCHILHGEPIAINAGSAACVLAERPLMDIELRPEAKLRIYQLFFEGARARHVGQALELAGMDDLLANAVESGKVVSLERRVLAIHRLKTGVPSGLTARMGAILGQGTETQIEALGSYFEAAGLAMRIVDDVVRLRRFVHDLRRGDDDAQPASITLPIVKGLEAFEARERAWIARLVRSRLDAETAAEMIARLEQVGALEATEAQARGLVEAAWACLDPVIPDSQQKMLFRAFGWYVLSRHADTSRSG